MRTTYIILFLALILLSCEESETKKKELEIKERELALKEKELELKTKDTVPVIPKYQDTAKVVKPQNTNVPEQSIHDNLPTDGSAITEFTKEMLLSEADLTSMKSSAGLNHSDKVGVIKKVSKEVKNEINTILINKTWINVNVPSEGKNMCKECLVWFNKMVKPGTKIKYSYHCEPNEFKETDCEWMTLTYLKVLSN